MVIKLGLQLTSSQLYNRTLAICFSKYESTRFPNLLWPDFIILIHLNEGPMLINMPPGNILSQISGVPVWLDHLHIIEYREFS